MNQLVIIFLLLLNQLFCQTTKTVVVTFQPNYGNTKLVTDSFLKLNDNDSLKFESLKFYISNIKLLDNRKLVWQQENSFYLIDITDEKSLKILITIPSSCFYNELQFNLGIDSITNVSGAMGKALDPTKGMYWTWQSGYINFKLEGKSNVCKTRNNEFQFHLGGYQTPHNALQTINLELKSKHSINVKFDLKHLVSFLDLSKTNHIMSPSKEAVELSRKISQLFNTL